MTDRDPDALQHRIDEVGEHIEQARQQAEDDDILIDPDERRFHESGEVKPDEDDQTIAPG
jgi:hypothetical protein